MPRAAPAGSALRAASVRLARSCRAVEPSARATIGVRLPERCRLNAEAARARRPRWNSVPDLFGLSVVG
jgi:hypothetical protein